MDGKIDVKEAVRIARDFVREVFENEKLSNLGLEEVEYSTTDKEWRVTIGFSRPWDYPKKASDPYSQLSLLKSSDYERRPERDYKIVLIDAEDGHVNSVKNRFVPEVVEV